MGFGQISPEDFKKGEEVLIYKSIILKHFDHCITLGSTCSDRTDFIRFERSIKMLESAIAHRISTDYQTEVAKLMMCGQKFLDAQDYDSYYEVLRTRFMLITQELSFLGYMPEERAIDVIGANDSNEDV
jgi:hypothetical protein